MPEPNRHPASTRATQAGPAPDAATHTAELALLLEAYLAELEAGRCPDRARWVAAHPGFDPALGEALAGLDFIHRATPEVTRSPVLLGDFRILREIGRGGMGVVYEAEQVSLKRRVALKVLGFGSIVDEVAVWRFQREAETVGRLHHTNIVPIFAVGTHEGVPYYAMQFIEGRDLGRVAQDLRATSGSVDFPRIADWGLQAAEALAHAHQRGVVHRDIKPSNLILDGEDRIWLTDFGLARRLDEASRSLTGALLGTPRYMSPEQAAAAKQPIDHRTDLYSLGATLYELVTGRPIFEGTSAHEVIALILQTDPKPPRAISPQLPRDLETIILKCLAKDPARRYATARALAEDLRAFVAGRSIAARRPRLIERTTRWLRRHQRLVTTGTASAVASVLLFVGLSLAWKSYRAARLGSLQLSTTTPGALAEILDEQGRVLVPVLPVPNETPIPLPEGNYQVRLSAPGTLSETWPVEIPARSRTAHALSLSPRWLWPPQNLGDPQRVEQVPVGDKSGFLVLIPPTGGESEPAQPTRLRLLDAETTKPLWPADLAFDASTAPPENLAEWQLLFAPNAIAPTFAGTHIAERITDLDRDGAGDFILVSRFSASVVAISGAAGRVLWWHRSRPPLPPDIPRHGRWTTQPAQSFVVSHPAVADLDGDGIDDTVACFRSNGETYVAPDGTSFRIGAQSWLASISGRTGLELWRRSVAADWSRYVSSSLGARFETLAHPRVLRLQGRSVVVLPDQDRLLVCDGRTGQPLGDAWRAGFTIERVTGFCSPEGDDRVLALLGRRVEETDAHFELVAQDLVTGSLRWRNRALTVPSGVAGELDVMPAEAFQAVNLRADGPGQIVTFTARHPGPDHWTFGVQVLDAGTGVARWETHLYAGAHPQSIPSQARIAIGPDLNRDRSRDLFVVLPAYDASTRRHGILAVALSGADGSLLWRQHHPGFGGAVALSWWQEGADGWPLLVVPTLPTQGGRASTLVLEAGSGRIAHVLLDVREVQVADLDGDGAPDLFHPTRAQGTYSWTSIRGLPAPIWQRFGDWRPGLDADQDGTVDLFGLSRGGVSARSGHDGRLLWTTPAEAAAPESIWVVPPLPGARETQAAGAVLVAVHQPRPPGAEPQPARRSLAAFSPRDGRRLWTAANLDLGLGSRNGSALGWAFDYPRLEFSDLDGDGAAEVLASCVTSANELRLCVVSGANGDLLWETPMVDGAMAPDPRPGGAPLADFNRDGVRDLALVLPPQTTHAPPASAGFSVDVLDGRTGRSLWPAPFVVSSQPNRLAWPEPTLGDLDGDQIPEVLVVRHSGYRGDRGYRCEVILLDGRTGLPRWQWAWDSGFPMIWPPLVLTSPDPAQRRVALGLSALAPEGPGTITMTAFSVMILDAAGQPMSQREIQLIGHGPDRGGQAWDALDLDGDGTTDLVYPSAGFLCGAFGPDYDVRWRVPLPSQGAEGFRVVRAPASEASANPTLVLWAGREVLGIHGASGEIVWGGHAPGSPLWGTGHFPHFQLAPNASAPGLPGLHFLPPIARGDGAILDRTWPTAPKGHYRFADAAP